MRSLFASMILAPIAAGSLHGCVTKSEAPESALDTCIAATDVDPFRTLVFVDDEIVNDPRARNDLNGPWSFRRRMEEFALPGEDPATLVTTWLERWRSRQRVNLFDVEARVFVEQKGLCNWLRSTPSNGCDETCGQCAERKFDLANAPFKLLAMVNRADLVTIFHDPTTAGEVRFVYGLTDGPGDNPRAPLFMTVIFEYRQPLRGRTRKETAQAWHSLGRHTEANEAFKSELDGLIRTFVEPGAEELRPRGSSLSQVRTNEREFEWQWDLREFVLRDEGLTLMTVENTPDETLNGSEQLARHLRDNREAVLAGQHVLPSRLAGGRTGILLPALPWAAPDVDATLLTAFSNETCNGCHQNKQHDFNFHISPFKSGRERLSPFVFEPGNPNSDVAKRTAFMRTQLCTP